MKIVEMGGAQELLNMLVAAKDDRTRKEALKALSALSHSGQTLVCGWWFICLYLYLMIIFALVKHAISLSSWKYVCLRILLYT